MKKVTSLLLLAGVAAFGLVGCGDEVVPPPDDPPTINNVEVTPASLSLDEGESATVSANITTSNGVQGISVAWSSGNSSVASVSPTGDRTAEVTASAEGNTTVTATVTAENVDGEASGSASVSVVKPVVNSVSVSPSNASIQVGGTVSLVASVDAEEGADTSVTWTTSDASIASVDADGQDATVTGEGAGTATITVESVQNPDKRAAASVEVAEEEEPAVNSVSLSQTSASLLVGGSVTLVASVDAEEGADTSVSWSTSDQSVASLDVDGKQATVTGESAGQAVVTVESVQNENKSASANVSVSDPGVNSISITPSTATIDPGGTVELVASVDADEGADFNVSWSSADTNIAEVTSTSGDNNTTATITGNSAGTAAISAQAGDQSATASVEVRQIEAAQVSFSAFPGSPLAGSVTLTLNVDPGDQIVDEVSLKVDGDVVATSTFGTSSSEGDVSGQVQTVSLTFNTAEIDTDADGNTRFKNGEHTVTAELTTTSGDTGSDAQTSVTTDFANTNGFLVTDFVVDGPSATNGGVNWFRGDLNVDVMPVIFTPDMSVGEVSVTLSAGGTSTDADPSDGFGFTFPDDETSSNAGGTPAGVGDVESTGVSFGVSSLWADGTTGPGTIIGSDGTPTGAPSVAIDNVAPATPGSFVLADPSSNDWINEDYAFSSGLSLPSPPDGGSGGVTSTFFAGAASASAGDLSEVSSGGDVTSSTSSTNSAFRAFVRLEDQLGNSDEFALGSLADPAAGVGTTFGVDIEDPTASLDTGSGGDSEIVDGIAFDDAAPAGQDVVLAFSDPAPSSQFAAEPVRRTVVRQNPDGSIDCVAGVVFTAAGITCTKTITGTPGAVHPAASAGIVDDDRDNSDFDLIATAGYYTYDGFVRDEAGNRSEDEITVRYAFDATPPSVGGLAFPGTLPGGASVTFSAQAQDNLDLIENELVLRGGTGGFATPFDVVMPRQSIGEAFDGATAAEESLVQSATAQHTVGFFLRSLEEVTAAGSPSNTAGATTASWTTAGFWVFDVASVESDFDASLSQYKGASEVTDAIGGAISPPADAWTTDDFTSWTLPDGTGIDGNLDAMVSLGADPDDGTTARAVAELDHDAGDNNPFPAGVEFYWNDPEADDGAGAWRKITGTVSQSVTTSGGTTTRTFTIDFVPAEQGMATLDAAPTGPGLPSTVEIRAVGLNGSGDAAITTVNTDLTIED